LPVYAIGGIGRDELPELAAAGVVRIAAIRLFFGAAPQKPRVPS
jgi:thiamine monophosphate synthase